MKYNNKQYSISLMISAFSTAMATGILSILLNEIIDTFQVSGTKEGLMSSMVSLGSLISLCVIVLLQKKFSKAYLIIGLGLLTIITLLLQGLAGSYIIFLALCFILGFGNGGTDTCQSSFLADLNPSQTSKYMGMLHGLFGLASIVSPLFLRSLLKHNSYRTVYIITGLVSLVFMAQFIFFTFKNKKTIAEMKPVNKKSSKDISSFFKGKYNIVLLLFIFFGAAAQSGVITWVIRYVSTDLNENTIATVCLSAYWIFATISRFFSPSLPFKPYTIIAGGALISAIAWATAIMSGSSVLICVACGLVGLTSGSCIPMVLSEGANNNRENTGFSTSILMILKTTAQILSPVFIAFFMSITSMKSGMLITATFFLADAILGIFLKKYYNNQSFSQQKEV